MLIHGIRASTGTLLVASFCLLVVYFAGSLTSALLNAALSGAALESVRRTLLSSYFASEWSVQSQERLGHIQQLLTFNATNVAGIMTALAGGLQSFLTALALLLTAFFVDPEAAILVLLLGTLLSLALRPLNSRSKRSSRELSTATESYATLATEYTRLAREFRLFGVEDEAIGQLDRQNVDSARVFRINRRLGQLAPVFYQTLALAFVIVAVAVLTSRHGTQLATIGAVFLLMLRTLTYGSSIQSTLQQLRSFEGFIDALRLDCERYAANRVRASGRSRPASCTIVFDRVSFSYDGENPVLRQLSFAIPERTLVAIVGRSGSGKTTLSQLLLGLRQPTTGLISLGGVEPASIEKRYGPSPLAFVPQEPVLLQGSIQENIAFFRNVSMDAIQVAAWGRTLMTTSH